jgi:hypothetical protein
MSANYVADWSHVMIATPAYQGIVCAGHMKGLLESQGLYGGRLEVRGESNSTIAHNIIANAFLRSNYRTLIKIDADVGFGAVTLAKVLEAKGSLVSAYVPHRDGRTGTVGVTTGQLMGDEELIAAKAVGMSFTRIDRQVFEDIAQKVVIGTYRTKEGYVERDFFPSCAIDDQLLSGAFAFCEFARWAGHPAHVAISARCTHAGWTVHT